MSKDRDDRSKRSLSDDQITSRPSIGRRGFLGVAGVGLPAMLVTGRAAEAQTGLTDADTGANADPVGWGRGGGPNLGTHTGYTDQDYGPRADRAGQGVGPGGSGLTDSDTGAYADPVGNGTRGW